MSIVATRRQKPAATPESRDRIAGRHQAGRSSSRPDCVGVEGSDHRQHGHTLLGEIRYYIVLVSFLFCTSGSSRAMEPVGEARAPAGQCRRRVPPARLDERRRGAPGAPRSHEIDVHPSSSEPPGRPKPSSHQGSESGHIRTPSTTSAQKANTSAPQGQGRGA